MTMTWITRKGEGEKTRRGAIFALAAVLFCSFLPACGANEGILKSGKEKPDTANSAPTRSSIEADVDEMRTANFMFIYVLRRKDAGAIDAEDRGVIKLQTDGVNRRIGSDNGKAFVIGSNFEIPADKMLALYDRFAVENYSPSDNATGNVTTNTSIK